MAAPQCLRVSMLPSVNANLCPCVSVSPHVPLPTCFSACASACACACSRACACSCACRVHA
eukprot:6806374-Alexandrium_andersonii.AAC.1